MHKLFTLALLLLCSSCTLPPTAVPVAQQKHSNAVVFDIDGTLTPTVMKIWKARGDAAKAAHIYAKMGYKIIYLSARVAFFQANIPGWLEENGFPNGTIHVTETDEDASDHAKFKSRILRKYRANGWKVVFAYGDSSSDFEAYASVGIPKAHVYALRREGDTNCQPGIWKDCLNGWKEHVDSIEKLVIACQQDGNANSDAC